MLTRFNLKNIIVIIFVLVAFFFIATSSIHAATFTVDSTGDEADLSNDGLCLTSLGTCTLRAALTAASNLAGADNIYFNIPTSDPGYRDYDDPNTPSSGDSTGGDDYWSIRPVTLLGYVFGTIDGETQEINSGFDRNIYGPDIEIDASGIPNPGPQDQGIVGLLSTNGTINKLVLNSYGYGAGIVSNANGVTITKNYIGTDVKGLVAKPSVTGIGLNQSNNVVIGNDSSDGNIITATQYGIINQCTNPNPNKISGNRIGIGADGVTALPMHTAIFMHTNCNSIIGGDTVAERNYIASTISYAVRFEGNINATTAVHQIYNNYFGTDVNGNIVHALEIKDAAIADVYGGDDIGYKTLTIGAEGKGNLIANSRYGIRLNVPKSIVTISSNTIVKTIWGVLGYRYSNPDPDNDTNWYDDINIYNNYIGDYADPDPYFGLTFEPGDWTCTDCYDQNYINRTGISIGGFNGTIKGNKIIGNLYNGIVADNYSSLSVNSVIGGQNAFTGSLCQGLEKNCIEDNGTHPLDEAFGGGIFLTMSAPTNFDTIYQDNYFGNGNGYQLNESIGLYTNGEFELLSGTTRRTDLSNFELTIQSPDMIELYDGWGGSSNDGHPGPTQTFTNYNVYCTDPGYCPVSGSSSGVDEMTSTLISKLGYEDYEPDWFQYYITDAYNFIPMVKFDNEGNRIENTLIKFEENHFSSQEFSFDADSTTHPQDYPGIGEPWTDDITATQAVSLTKNYYSTESGIKQVMEVQYVDANPIRQNDGSFIIYVDSTTDEDNVSTCDFDDGYGAYSGGGCEGVDGLPNGKTSLREAMIVANSGLTPLKIEFNIPTSDTGYRDYDDANTSSSGDSANGDDYFLITLASSLPDIVSYKEVIIDGATQETNSGNNRNTFGPDILITGAGVATNIFKTLTDTATKDLLDLTINGFILSNTTGELIATNYTYIAADASENVTITNNYFCTDAKGLQLSSDCATHLIDSDTIKGELNISNNLFGWFNSNINNIALRLGSPTATSHIEVINNKFGTNPAGTLLTKAVDGYGIFIESDIGGALLQNNIINTTQGTCIFSRGYVVINNNYCGTDVSGETIFNVSEIYAEGPVTITNNVVARIITLEDGLPLVVSNNTIGANKSKTQKFDLSRFVGSGQTAPTAQNLAAYETWNGVGEFKNNYISSTHNGIYIRNITSPDSIHIQNNTFNNISATGIRMRNITGVKISENIFTNISSGNQSIDLLENNVAGVNTNDSGDADSYASNTIANNGMNSPVIQSITYVGGGKYLLEGVLDNNVNNEGPFDLEICLSNGAIASESNCVDSLFFQENYITQVTGGINPWQAEVTVPGSDGTSIIKFSALATNNAGFTSEFGTNVSIQDVPFEVQTYPITLSSPINSQTLTSGTPLLKWQSSTDPDLKQYAIYINGAFYATVDKTSSQLQIPTTLANGNYTWYVVGVRNNNTESGRSITLSFSISAQNENPVSYVTLSPISEEPKFVSFPISYTSSNSEGLGSENDFSALVNQFLVSIQGTLKVFTANSAELLKQASNVVSPAIPLFGGVVLAVTAIPANSLPQLGALIGAYIQRRKRYFGIVYDLSSKEIIPLASIELVSLEGKIVDRSISDFKGRYSLSIDSEVEYKLVVKAEGYETKEIMVSGMYKNNVLTYDIDLKRNSKGLIKSKQNRRFNLKATGWVFRALKALTIVGFIYSLFVYITSPSLINGLILIVYIVVFIVNIYVFILNKLEKPIVILNTNGIPVKGVVFKVINKDGGVVDAGITNKEGVMKVRLEKGEYNLLTNNNGEVLNQSIKVNARGFVQGKVVLESSNTKSSSIQSNPFS